MIHDWNFITLSDDVEPVDKVNGFYLHRLTVVQNTHELSHRLLRNSVFQQPLDEKVANTYVRGSLLVTATANQGGSGYIFNASELKLPGSTGEENIYRKDLIYIENAEKINNVFIDLNSYCLHFNNINFGVTTGGYQANIGWTAQGDKTWKRNRHLSFPLILEYRASSSASPSATQTIYVDAGNSDNFTKTQQLTKTFFESHGAGWYSIALDTDNLPTFNLANSEMSFGVTTGFPDTPVANVPYPNILVMLDIKLRIDTYYYSLWDVLDIIRKQTLKTLNNENRGTSPYILVPKENSDLSNIVAPDFQFTGGTVFDAVSQVFNYIDAVPVILKEKRVGAYTYANVLDYEYLNEFNGELLPSDYKFADKKTRIEDKYYDNQIITQYRNAKQPTPINYPAKNRYKKLEANVYGVVDSVNAYKITTDKPIEKINKLNIILPTGNIFSYRYPLYYQFVRENQTYTVTDVYYGGGDSQFSLPYTALDIAPILVESSIYRSLPVGSPSASTRNKNNTLMFTKGTNYIPIGTYEELGYTSINLADAINKLVQETFAFTNDIIFSGTYGQYNLYDVYYSIEYVATFEGQTMVESPENKKEGQYVVAQNSSSAALNKMGSNMLGFIAKTGNESKVVTMQLNTYDTRLTKGSMWIDSNNNKWIANIVKITFTTSEEIITEVEFVKNFNMISQRTQVDEEIKYTVLNNSLVNKAFENVNEYLYFSYDTITDENNTSFTDSMVQSLFEGTFNADISQAYPGDCAVQLDNNQKCFVPIHIYGAGNVINFELNYEDSKQAGMYIDTSNRINGKVVLYTEDGFGENMNVSVYKQQTNGVLQYSNYPIYNSTDHTLLFSFDYKYYKRENEILSFNYGIALMSNPGEEIYFGEEFISQNYLIPNNKYVGSNDRKLYFYISQDEKYNIGSKKALGDRQTNLNISINATNKTITITADWGYYTDAISWCIADENENIYIAGNQDLIAENSKFTVVLHYAKRKFRI